MLSVRMIPTGVRALAWSALVIAAWVAPSLARHAEATVGNAGRAIGGSPMQMETGTVTDVDGNTYRTVRIGTQWWMVEDLRVTRDPAGKAIPSRSYADDESHISTYGRLYSWSVAMNGATEPGAQGIAPPGWRIPSDDDWNRLFTFLGGEAVAGGALKEVGTSHWLSPNTGATDAVGFRARPGGGSDGRVFDGLGVGAHYWSSTGSGSEAGAPTLNMSEAGVTRLRIPKEFLASVLCVRVVAP